MNHLSAFISGKCLVFASLFRAAITVDAHRSTKFDSLMPSRTAALITKYSTHMATMNTTNSTADQKIVSRVISAWNCWMGSKFMAVPFVGFSN